MASPQDPAMASSEVTAIAPSSRTSSSRRSSSSKSARDKKSGRSVPSVPPSPPHQPAKRTGKTKHIQCALCSQPLPDNYLKKLCQSCIESTLREESSVRSEDIRSMIREELQAFRSSEKISEGRKKYNSPRSEQSSETEDKDSDGSQRIISSDDERDTCFPTDSIDNLVRSVCNTMGIEDTKIPKTPQDVMFAGLSERKKPSFPVIPAIKNVVKKEWESQGQRGLPSSSKRRYPFNDEDFSIWLKAPKVDAAVASTSKKSLLPVEDSGSLQDPLDRKADTLLKRAWESCTGAFRPAISATCTARSMLVWLNDLEEGLKSGLSRDRLISSIPLIRGATAFLADSSADSIRLAAKSAGLTNAARRALWLKGWKGDPQTKSKLCGLPCQGEYLFGTKLDEILTKAGERKKGFPNNTYLPSYRRAFRKPTFNRRKDYKNQDRWANKDFKQKGAFFGKRPFKPEDKTR
ncbi:lamina-associated polypeptide 2, isoforms alpha/zeta-like [Ranitomeya variabilis]|uniref:lamina-associated polypeptide 2, isoforms alpha/zeta-like n=1 Tax=Ranitomeya variabilis TaxID=490064 RepID=UPI004055F53E